MPQPKVYEKGLYKYSIKRELTNLKEILGRVVYANNCLDYDARPEIYTDVFRLYDNLFESQEKRKKLKSRNRTRSL